MALVQAQRRLADGGSLLLSGRLIINLDLDLDGAFTPPIAIPCPLRMIERILGSLKHVKKRIRVLRRLGLSFGRWLFLYLLDDQRLLSHGLLCLRCRGRVMHNVRLQVDEHRGHGWQRGAYLQLSLSLLLFLVYHKDVLERFLASQVCHFQSYRLHWLLLEELSLLEVDVNDLGGMLFEGGDACLLLHGLSEGVSQGHQLAALRL